MEDRSLSKNDSLDDIRDRVGVTDSTQLYQIKDSDGKIVDFEEASGRQIFNHYRHNMTNYDEVLDTIRADQGYVTGRQEKKAAVGAAEQVLEKYRDEHVKVIQDSQKKGHILKKLMQKCGVATASAVSAKLDEWSEKIKEVGHLEKSQSSLRTWNDIYRVQRELVKRLLAQEDVSKEIVDRVNTIYGAKSIDKSVEIGSNLFNLEKSEILKLLKSSIKYKKSDI